MNPNVLHHQEAVYGIGRQKRHTRKLRVAESALTILCPDRCVVLEYACCARRLLRYISANLLGFQASMKDKRAAPTSNYHLCPPFCPTVIAVHVSFALRAITTASADMRLLTTCITVCVHLDRSRHNTAKCGLHMAALPRRCDLMFM